MYSNGRMLCRSMRDPKPKGLRDSLSITSMFEVRWGKRRSLLLSPVNTAVSGIGSPSLSRMTARGISDQNSEYRRRKERPWGRRDSKHLPKYWTEQLATMVGTYVFADRRQAHPYWADSSPVLVGVKWAFSKKKQHSPGGLARCRSRGRRAERGNEVRMIFIGCVHLSRSTTNNCETEKEAHRMAIFWILHAV